MWFGPQSYSRLMWDWMENTQHQWLFFQTPPAFATSAMKCVNKKNAPPRGKEENVEVSMIMDDYDEDMCNLNLYLREQKKTF